MKKWARKKMAVRIPKKVEKSEREKRFLHVKKIKNMTKNGFHAQNDFHAQKKKTLPKILLKNTEKFGHFSVLV